MITSVERLPEITTACPSWCTLKPGHEYDSIHDDGRHSRGHAGPRFGPYLHAGADEFSDAPGVLVPEVQLIVDGSVILTTPDEIARLTAAAVLAGQWLLREQVRAEILAQLKARQAEVQA